MRTMLLTLFIVGTLMHQSTAHVQLLNPVGGESFTPGSQITIEWQEVISHETLNWDILFSSDGGNTWETVQLDVSVNTFSYFWIVPETPTSQGRIKVVQDNVDTDYEDISDDFVISSITGFDASPGFLNIKIYPNPVIDLATINYENPDYDRYSLTVYKTNGQLVRTITDITSDKILIEKKDLASGLYIFQLNSIGGRKYIGRFVVE